MNKHQELHCVEKLEGSFRGFLVSVHILDNVCEIIIGKVYACRRGKRGIVESCIELGIKGFACEAKADVGIEEETNFYKNIN